uniref:Uncharacterized protein n=1 Tax=viral metagenome TaxID=1070528 RepID=A0A6M3IK35_9ZZZZ
MPDLPEIEAYRATRVYEFNPVAGYDDFVLKDKADAALVAMEQACNDRERCGNCEFCLEPEYDGSRHVCGVDPKSQNPPMFVWMHDRCRFDPSRWELCDG